VPDIAVAKKKERIRVLHVDDDSSLREIFKLILQDLDSSFEIDQACCVDEAFKQLFTSQYDIIISDYEMPQKDGLQFLTELRERKNNIPFILFTGKGREEVAIKALNLGADGYFNKQGTPETVYGELAHGIRQSVEREKAKATLRVSEENFRAYLESSPVSVFVANQEGKYEYVNEAACRLLAYSKEELLNMSVQQVVPKEDADRRRFAQLKDKGYFAQEIKLERKNGMSIDVFLSAAKLPDGKLVAFCEDISERKKAEAALVQEYNKFKSVTEAIGAGLAIINKDYHVLWANDFIKQYKGEVTGKLCFATLNSLNAPCIDCGVAKIFAGKTTFDSHEYCSTTVDGNLYWVEIVATPITDGYGNITSAVEIAIDITERKKAEEHRKVLERKVKNYSEHLKCMVDLRTAQLKDANQRLMKSERFAAIGELAGMIGHDLRNPLAGIKNATYYLKKKGTTISEAQIQEMIEIIDKAIDHSDKIINDLLDYSREMHLELTKYSAYALVNDTLEMLKVPDRIKIVNRVQQDDWIWVNTDKMLRVFINLVKNSIDAMPEKGTLEISSCQRNNCVEIVFADTGTGIPEEIMEKLFTPLFTTKAQGMGFGLAICKRIVEAHGGTIKVKSQVNKGTTFIICLPPKR
jgi:PAS domain S-box-containing protein